MEVTLGLWRDCRLVMHRERSRLSVGAMQMSR